MAAALLGLLILAAPASAREVALENPSFEATGEGPAGWTSGVGAHHGADAPANVVVVDREVASAGKASLRCSGDAATRTWHLLSQTVPVAAGERVVLRVAVRARGVVRQPPQYANANGLLLFKSAEGKRLGLVTTPKVWGDREWVDLTVHALAPPGTVTVEVGVFASMTGSVWFDDVRLSVTSGDVADEEDRRAAFAALGRHLQATYPFWGFPGRTDLDDLLARHEKPVTDARDEDAFLRATAAMLDELHDVHVGVRDRAGRFLGTPVPGKPVLWSADAINARLTEGAVNAVVSTGWIGEPGPDAVGYLCVGSFQLDATHRELLERLTDELLASCGSLIIDVRPNGGGDEVVAQALAGRFVSEPLVYARHAYRDPSLPGLGGLYPPQQRVLRPHGARFEGRVVVLQGPGCVSSTEGFLLMMKAIPQATLVGEPSRGASANPGPFELLPGLPVQIPRWRSLTLDGTCIEGVGVRPDVDVAPAKDFLERDAALEKALEILGS